MNTTLKVWTGLGVATALMGAGLAGCAGENGENGADAAQAGEAGAGESGEGEGGTGEGGEGEGGEGEAGAGDGEGGVAIGEADSDPVVYLSALAIVEAHAVAARDAYRTGKADVAAEMFAHPVSEVLADMDPVFTKLGAANFTDEMSTASQAALKADNQAAVDEAFAEIMASIDQAAAKAPASDLSKGAISAGVVADQIDRAIAMYGRETSGDPYGPYLDGYGFYRAAARAFESNGAAIATYNSGHHADIKAALDLLGTAYPGVERPATLAAERGKLLGASSKVQLGLPAA
ncbi:MAG: hypothetical protein V2J14_04995 [Erythrobacter sp.]|jgi:hypothetical protein|nr:hypothetical protein [Erythrobacter sp.]